MLATWTERDEECYEVAPRRGQDLASIMATQPLHVTESDCQQAEKIGYLAGRDDPKMRPCIPPGMQASSESAFVQAIANWVEKRPVFARHRAQVAEVARIITEKYATSILSISDQARAILKSISGMTSLRHAPDSQRDAFVARIVPEATRERVVTGPLLVAFWVGWKKGSQVARWWQTYLRKHAGV